MAVTAYPVILVDSTDGAASDTAASGAGPSTALTGTSASTDVAGTLVTLDGSPDLSGVATDGSHVIYVADATTGNKRFAAINAVDDTLKTVTVEQAFAGSLSGQSWAIGGVRATAFGSVSELLYDQNGSAGDAQFGWTIRMLSGHTEALGGSQIDFRQTGTPNSEYGWVTIEGEQNAATMPEVTANQNDEMFFVQGEAHLFRWFSMKNTNTSGQARCIVVKNRSAVVQCVAESNGSTCMEMDGNGAAFLGNYCIANSGAGIALDNSQAFAIGNYIDASGNTGSANGISLGSNDDNLVAIGNVIHSPPGNGIDISYGGSDHHLVMGNTIYEAGGDGISIGGTGTADNLTVLINNLCVGCGGYGINISNVNLARPVMQILNNAFYNNTSGDLDSTADLLDVGTVSLTEDPFEDAANQDFRVKTGLGILNGGFPQEFINNQSGTSRGKSNHAIGAFYNLVANAATMLRIRP